jgi:hypothetical protein
MSTFRLTATVSIGLLAVGSTAQDATTFNIFPAVNATQLAQSLGWSHDCLVAM